jgi:hypothetical protein
MAGTTARASRGGAVNILILLHVFLFVLIVEQDIVFIHDAVFFFIARVFVCVFCVSTGSFRG